MGFILTILAILFGAQLIRRPLKFKVIRILSLSSVGVIFAILFYWSASQYFLWLNSDSPARFLLPPHQDIGYFFYYVFFRFWATYLISLIIAILFFIAAKFLNKKYQERFFYEEEPYLLAASIFLVGHPGWIFYLLFLLIAALILSLVIGHRLSRRVSLYYLWIPVAILSIIVSRWLSALPIVKYLSI